MPLSPRGPYHMLPTRERRLIEDLDESQRGKPTRSRSPPLRMLHHFRPRGRDDITTNSWRYPRPYYRSPSPVRSGGGSHRMIGSPLPSSSRRCKEYYQGDYGISRSLRPSPRVLRDNYYREDVNVRERHQTDPEGSSHRSRGYDYPYEYGTDSYPGKGRSFKLVSQREPTRHVVGLIPKKDGEGVSSLSSVAMESVSSRRYFGQMVERSSKYEPVIDKFGARWDGRVSPSSLRRLKDGRIFDSVSEEYPTTSSLMSGVEKVASTVSGPNSVSEKFPARTRSNRDFDAYGSCHQRYVDDLGYLGQSKVNLGREPGCRRNLDGVSADTCPFGDGSRRLGGPPTKDPVTESGPRVFDNRESSEVLLPRDSIAEDLGVTNWRSGRYRVEKEDCALRNVNGEWCSEESPGARFRDSFRPRKILVRRNADAFDARNCYNDNDDVFDDEYASNNDAVENDDLGQLLSPPHIPGENDSDSMLKHNDFSAESNAQFGVSKDIKLRLGGSASNVKMRLGPIQNVKQRLGPIPTAVNLPKLPKKGSRTLPWLEKKERRITFGNDKRHVSRKFDPSVPRDAIPKINPDPPEDTEDFKQMVWNSCFKFLKLLNENPASHTSYVEQGESGSFTCSVCGSTEFSGSTSLAQHAFQTRQPGFRAEHLGFHRALCVLMGWKCAELPTSLWTRVMLSPSEAASVKNDFIIWPPVVFIHECTISNANPRDGSVESIDQLKQFLYDVGIGDLVTNLSRGKAANKNMVVVSFKGTYSGLRQAERLHKLFVDGQRGRNEFHQLTLGSRPYRSSEAVSLSESKMGNSLYGYLGTASDLCKLDFEMKKKYVVRSKKEFDSLAGGTNC